MYKLTYQVATALSYFIVAVMALEFATIAGNATLMWPSSGIALVVLLRLGYRYIAGIFVGAFMAGVYVGNPHHISAMIALGNSLEPISIAYLLQRFTFSTTFYRINDYLSLVIFGSLGAVVSALFGVSALLMADFIPVEAAFNVAVDWWMGDVLGIILIAPFLLLFSWDSFYKLIQAQKLEALALLIVTSMIALVVFNDWHSEALTVFSGAYLLIIPLVWSALRFNQLMTALIVFEYFSIAVWGLLHNQGLFIDAVSSLPNLELFWFYFVVLSISSLLVAYAVNEKNTLYQAINSSKTETYIFCEKDFRFEFVNQAALDNLGLTFSQALRLSPLDIKPLYSDKQFADILQPLLNKETSSIHYETVIQRQDGTLYPVEIMIQLVAHANRRCYIASVVDISARQEREQHRILGDHVSNISPQAIMITNKDNKIIRVNKAFTDLTGYGSDEVVGENPHILSSGHHDNAFYEQLWQTLNVEGGWHGEIYNRRKNGELYLQDLTISILHDPLGEIQNHIAMFTDITVDREQVMKLKHLSEHDVLTELPNRSKLQQEFDFALASAKRNQNKLALLYMDLNDFKPINDSYGHTKGDEVLKVIADRIGASIRETDMASRIGGDEFVVLMTNIEVETACQTLIEKLKATIVEPINIDDVVHQVSVSIGMAEYPGHGDTLDSLLVAADQNMYQDKTLMKNS